MTCKIIVLSEKEKMQQYLSPRINKNKLINLQVITFSRKLDITCLYLSARVASKFAWKHQEHFRNLFYVNNKDTMKMSFTSFWCLYC